jgi:hypothetical protein
VGLMSLVGIVMELRDFLSTNLLFCMLMYLAVFVRGS